MIILRQKKFTALDLTEADQMTPRDLQLENMKMQRQIMINQRTREKLEADRAKSRLKAIQAAQRMEQQKEIQESKNQIQTQKLENAQDLPRNVNLYKSKSKTVEPVSMPK